VRGDYRFEVSLHAMGGFDDASPSTRRMFAELGVLDALTPVKAGFMYRTYYPGGVVFDTPDGLDAYRERLIQQFPDEADGIDRLFRDAAAMVDVLAAYMAGDETFNAYMMTHPDDVGRFVAWAYGALGDTLREYVTDPHLFAILAQLASYVGVQPDRLSALYFFMMWNGYHLGGFYNFIGGSQSISDALAGVIEANGGTVLLNTAVTAFDVADGRVTGVRTDGGACLRADWFVSNVNLPATLDLIGREHLPPSYVTRIDGMQPGWPLVVVYLGTDQDFTGRFEGTHEFLIQDTWDTNEVFTSIENCDPTRSILLVANYSVLDPTAAPAGRNAISITGTVGDDCFDGWDWGDHGAFKEAKDAVARVFIDRVEAVLPGLSDHIEVMEVAAPQTLRAFTGNPRGTIYGWHQTPEQSLLERPGQEVPGLANLFLAGAWTFPGCGQSAVIQSGVMAADHILDAAATAR
jgi:prolycopene isomerase